MFLMGVLSVLICALYSKKIEEKLRGDLFVKTDSSEEK